MVIGQLKNPEVLPPTVEKLKDPELDARARMAFENILRMMLDESRESVHELARAQHAQVRESGVRLLMNYSDEESQGMLRVALADPVARVQAYAAYVLSRQRDDAALEVIQSCLKQDDTQVRTLAIGALASYPAETSLPLLVELAQQDDPQIAMSLMYTLSRYPEQEATEAIVTAAKNPSLKRTAINCLGRQNTAAAAAALGKFMTDEDSAVRASAEATLRRMRIPAAKEILEKKNRE
jgi:HEAT repeat protein